MRWIALILVKIAEWLWRLILLPPLLLVGLLIALHTAWRWIELHGRYAGDERARERAENWRAR